MTRFSILGCLLCLVGNGTPAGEKPKAEQPTPAEMKILELTNQERKTKDAPPLVLSLALCKLARAH